MTDAAAQTGHDACWAVLLAAGAGERLGGGQPKAFFPLAGRPLIYWSLRTFTLHPLVTDVLIVTPPDWGEPIIHEALSELSAQLGRPAAKIRGALPGGARRQDSVRMALQALKEMVERGPGAMPARCAESAASDPESANAATGASDDLLVLLHDAARPLVPPPMIDAIVTRWRSAQAGCPTPVGVVPIIPVDDTLKVVRADDAGRPGLIERTLPREGLWLAQTPQAFGLGSLLSAHEEAQAAGHTATDDAMLYEWKGWRVETVMGSPANRKVTYPEDLALLTRIFAEVGR
jgi:2-C-methyl-D-erythritol 4-phosphate cytidylyltransferase